MTSPVDNELLPPAGDGARLPALGTAEPTLQFLGRVKEVLETLLGRRGSKWDRAVTFRDLYAAGIMAPGTADGAWTFAAQDGISSSAVNSALLDSAAYASLVRRIGGAEDLAQYPEQFRIELQMAIDQIARERQADIQMVDRKTQTAMLSLASRLTEITAALGKNAAGVRSYQAAMADRTQASALAITKVSARLDNAGGTGVTVEESLSAQASDITGLQGQWSIKIEAGSSADPIIAGIDLAVEVPVVGAGASKLTFLADVVQFWTPGGKVVLLTLSGSELTLNTALKVNGSALINGTVTSDALEISTGGHIASGQTGFDDGNGFWIEGIGTGHGARISVGDSTGKKFVCDPASSVLEMNGASISGGSITSPTITTPTISPITGGTLTNISTSSGGTYYAMGTRTVTPAGGPAGATYTCFWSIDGDVKGLIDPNYGIYIYGSASGTTVELRAVAPAGLYPTYTVEATCTITCNGLNGYDSFTATHQFF